jgi:acyl dehydratase
VLHQDENGMNIQELAEQSAKIVHTYTVSQEVYDNFQRCSHDLNPLHTDQDFAKRKGFQSCVMYGNILNAFVSHFVGMLLPLKEVMILSQDISYHLPVYMNDEIALESSIDTVSEAVNAISYKLKFYRMGEKRQLVAKGHVQIGLLKGEEQ